MRWHSKTDHLTVVTHTVVAVPYTTYDLFVSWSAYERQLEALSRYASKLQALLGRQGALADISGIGSGEVALFDTGPNYGGAGDLAHKVILHLGGMCMPLYGSSRGV